MIPVARESLAPVLAPFGKSSTLPSEAYADEKVFRWELEYFFDRTWVCMGHAAACEGLQKGVSSRGYRQGPLSPREDAVYQFITMVARGYLEGEVSRPANRT